MNHKDWLKIVYILNGKNFGGSKDWESIPLDEIEDMLEVVEWANKQEKKAIEEARRNSR
ncbi:MAG: hypothetical protein F6K55_03415 [Moorea sp. SIO4A3]|nr:hypothetical protein [Moorena sp. SIO4A3]